MTNVVTANDLATSSSQDYDLAKIPKHVAIIMDGNGRWAEQRGFSRTEGHRQGAEAVRTVVRKCREKGVRALTLYAFSAQNWSRPNEEIENLMWLLTDFVQQERNEVMENNIRLITIGAISRLPQHARQPLQDLIDASANNNGMLLCLALSYGAREELLDAVRTMAEKVAAGTLTPEGINESNFSKVLQTQEIPWDPDLIIRTSGEQRLSNFLLWQAAYAELYFTDVLWPEFGERELDLALSSYATRERRFGHHSIRDDKEVAT